MHVSERILKEVNKFLNYLPVTLFILFLSTKYKKSPMILTKTNPKFPYGGMISSKTEIFRNFEKNQEIFNKYFAKTIIINPNTSEKELTEILKKSKFQFPGVIKPDFGFCGIGTELIKDELSLKKILNEIKVKYLFQEYCEYPHELGIFYIKIPGKKSGEIWSMTRRVFPEIIGDGKKSIEKFIKENQEDPKQDRYYVDLKYVPKQGEKIELVHLATPHTKFSYTECSELISPKIQERFNEISKKSGMYFGRFDIKVKDLKNFSENGEGFKILEANIGADSMGVHAFDKKYSRIQRLKILYNQFDIAFRIAIKNDSYKKHKHSKFIKEAVKYFGAVRRYKLMFKDLKNSIKNN